MTSYLSPAILLYMDDPYANTDRCVKRLFDVWTKHRSIIVAVDYDSTIASFDDQDHHPRVHDLLRRSKAAGFKIILFTAANQARHPFMVRHMEDLGFAPDSINANPLPLPFGHDGKPYFNHLIDDRAGLSQACDILEGLLNLIPTS